MFIGEDATITLATSIPAVPAMDHVTWSRTTNGKYTIKTGYQLWHAQNIGTSTVTQSDGGCKLWKVDLPHRIKLFLWRFCRNNVPVRSILSTKGVSIPLECPMCNSTVEDLIHIFFVCTFALACWHYACKFYDMSLEESAPSWLLTKFHSAPSFEVLLIAKVLWGIKILENKVVTTVLAMEWSAKSISEWKEAKDKCSNLFD